MEQNFQFSTFVTGVAGEIVVADGGNGCFADYHTIRGLTALYEQPSSLMGRTIV